MHRYCMCVCVCVRARACVCVCGCRYSYSARSRRFYNERSCVTLRMAICAAGSAGSAIRSSLTSEDDPPRVKKESNEDCRRSVESNAPSELEEICNVVESTLPCRLTGERIMPGTPSSGDGARPWVNTRLLCARELRIDDSKWALLTVFGTLPKLAGISRDMFEPSLANSVVLLLLSLPLDRENRL